MGLEKLELKPVEQVPLLRLQLLLGSDPELLLRKGEFSPVKLDLTSPSPEELALNPIEEPFNTSRLRLEVYISITLTLVDGYLSYVIHVKW